MPFATAEQHTFQRCHICIVSAPGCRDMLIGGYLVIGRVKVHPAAIGHEYAELGVRLVSANQPFPALGWKGFQITADITRRQTL